MKKSSWPFKASVTIALNSSSEYAHLACTMPAARAIPTRSVPVAVAGFLLPEASYTPLSNTMWTKFFGRMRARVGNEQRFISKDPSPSRAITFRWGKPNAIPKAMEEQSPKVRTRKLPSPGRRAFHSKVTAPAEVTTRASPVATAMVLKQSNLFICASHFKLAHRRWVLERLKRSSTAEEFFRQQQRH